jgi:hypothetical protein
MTCAVVRQRLLASERPDQPSPVDSHHLAGCPACHDWLRRLVQLERQLPQLNVPTSLPPAALLGQILRDPNRVPLICPRLPSRDQRRVREGGRQKLALAFSLAATLALFTLAWWIWPPQPNNSQQGSTRPRPWQPVVEGGPMRSPRERVDALATFAEDYLVKARAHANEPKRLAVLAREFDRLVQDDLFQYAREVPAAQRNEVLSPIADRLGKVEKDASSLAAQWADRHAASVEPIRRIAESAREADRRLRLLVQTRA